MLFKDNLGLGFKRKVIEERILGVMIEEKVFYVYKSGGSIAGSPFLCVHISAKMNPNKKKSHCHFLLAMGLFGVVGKEEVLPCALTFSFRL